MKKTYYYLEMDSGHVVVLDIARGGSKAGKITKYGHKSLEGNTPFLFTSKEDAQNTIEKSKKMSYYYRDGDGHKHGIVYVTWVIKTVEVNFEGKYYG